MAYPIHRWFNLPSPNSTFFPQLIPTVGSREPKEKPGEKPGRPRNPKSPGVPLSLSISLVLLVFLLTGPWLPLIPCWDPLFEKSGNAHQKKRKKPAPGRAKPHAAQQIYPGSIRDLSGLLGFLRLFQTQTKICTRPHHLPRNAGFPDFCI